LERINEGIFSKRFSPSNPGSDLPGSKQEREAGYSPPSSAEVNIGGTVPPFPYMSSGHSAYLNKDRRRREDCASLGKTSSHFSLRA
jgi:hypothetical protein